MVQATQHRQSLHTPDAHVLRLRRRARDGNLLREAPVGTLLVEVGDRGPQGAPEVALAQNEQVVRGKRQVSVHDPLTANPIPTRPAKSLLVCDSGPT